MRILYENKGVALVTSLMFTLISLALVLLLLYIVTQNISLSASHRRYKTALEASYGGVEVFTKEIIPQIFKDYSSAGAFSITRSGMTSSMGDISLRVASSDSCMMQKLFSPSSKWTNCTDDQKSSALASIASSPDMTFKLQGISRASEYTVFTKIVDTLPGNTDTSTIKGNETLLSGSGAAYNPDVTNGGINVKHIPARYRIEVQGEKTLRPLEKASISVLYAY